MYIYIYIYIYIGGNPRRIASHDDRKIQNQSFAPAIGRRVSIHHHLLETISANAEGDCTEAGGIDR